MAMPKAKQPNPIDIEVGRRIRTQRLASRISQTALGQKVGVTFQQVQKYEKGVNRVGAGRLQQIADVLGVRHLRGRIVPVLDGQRRMGVANVPLDPASVRIVMLAHAEHLVGLRVGAVGELLHSDGIEIEPPPPGRASRRDDPVTGVLSWQGGFVALLDVCRLCRLGGEAGHVA